MADTQQINGWDPHTRKVVFATKAKDVKSPQDQALFEAICIDSGLNPLRNEIYAVMRGGKLTPQTGIDGYLKMANSTKELDGLEVLFYDNEGNASEVWLSPKPPVACLVRVFRKGCSRPFVASCRYDAYKQGGQMWSKFPETMLAKATTTLALRRGFADVIGGIASADELDQAGLAHQEALTQGMQAVLPAPQAPVVETKPEPVAQPAAPKAEAKVAAKSLAKATDGEVVAVAEKVDDELYEAMALPPRDDLKGSVAKLYEVAGTKGLTEKGWRTLDEQVGGIDAGKAAKLLGKMLKIEQEKVALLNSGKPTA